MGCRDLIAWNQACSLKLIWLLFSNSGSIWVAWYKAEVLKGSLSNYWSAKQKPKYSWFTNKLLMLQDIAFDWITVKLGNGKEVKFWEDNWSPFGNFWKFLALLRANTMGIPEAATLHDLFVGDRWNVRPARLEKQVQVQAFLTSITLSQLSNEYEWTIDGKTWLKYQTGAVYKLLKPHRQLVPWKKTIWNSSGISRHSFHAWLVILNRLPTRDRIISWGISIPSTCLLCNLGDQSRDHLFFSCPFSWELWSCKAQRIGITPSPDWNLTLLHMQALPRPTWRRKLQLLVWQGVIYSLWQERNERLHRNSSKTVATISTILDRTIRNKIQAFRDANSVATSNMIQFCSPLTLPPPLLHRYSSTKLQDLSLCFSLGLLFFIYWIFL